MTNRWRVIDTGPNNAAYNMAFDEDLLERSAAGETMPVLRFYSWEPAAVSLGRFQDSDTAVNAEACRKYRFDIVRRITGGRAVLHRKELTYSIVARSDNGLFPPTVLGTYKVIAAGLVAGLRNLGLPARMVSRQGSHAALVQAKPKEAACFSSPSWYEILVNDRKIVGSAQRRVRGAFLQHGSILVEYDAALEAAVIRGGGAGRVTSTSCELGRDVPLEDLRQAFVRGFSDALGITFVQHHPGRSRPSNPK